MPASGFEHRHVGVEVELLEDHAHVVADDPGLVLVGQLLTVDVDVAAGRLFQKFMQRTVVDLPLPDGPIMTSFSPSATSRFTSLRTCRSPKYLSTCSSLITVIPAFPYPVLSSVLQRRGQRILCGFPKPHTKTKKQKRRKVDPSLKRLCFRWLKYSLFPLDFNP